MMHDKRKTGDARYKWTLIDGVNCNLWLLHQRDRRELIQKMSDSESENEDRVGVITNFLCSNISADCRGIIVDILLF